MKKFSFLFIATLLIGCGGGDGGSSSSGSTPSFSVVSTSPGSNGTEIPLSNSIKVTFDQDLNPATLNNSITVNSFIGNLPGTVSYDASNKTATFTPGTPFAPLTEYTVTVNTNLKSSNGESLSTPYISHFTTVTAFSVRDFVSGNFYLMGVTKVAEGAHCYIYLENGKTVSPTVIEKLKNEFDSTIYPRNVTNFGAEPNPGADGLPKVFIVLLDIRDGFNPANGVYSYLAGFFASSNEYSNVESYPAGTNSNQKDVIFMDINPGDPSRQDSLRTLAHEFQHMIHWEQKNNRLGLLDDTWLNEAMSEIAPFYAGYGPDYSEVRMFEYGHNRSDSLTVWNSDLPDYAVVYMWAQYMADRFPSGVFKSILNSPNTGITSVNSYLSATYPGLTFSSVFRDWSIAVFSGNTVPITNHPEWSYKSINTWPGTYNDITIQGIFSQSNCNIFLLQVLAPWSIDIYWYVTVNRTLTNNYGPPPQASFIDWENGKGILSFNFDMVQGQPYSYDNTGILILQNVSGGTALNTTGTNQSVQSTESTILTPLEKLKVVSENATAKKLVETTGEPIPICIQDYLLEQEKVMRETIRKKQNVQ